ncbi:type II toxin-antitoxin system RelB/DinJ family antitoxin [Thiotrichales bacterium HSG1]|nr:type II toxin-antitoxin system RelB/DinJ family antitoxin [Thiotrichales bacterium HSG1]
MQTNIEVDKASFNEAQKTFASFGMSASEAINLFLVKVSIEKTIPNEFYIPSNELLDRIEDVENNRNLIGYNSLEELFDDLGI